MSAAWLVGLGVAAGYLINKNHAISSRLDTSIAKYNSAAEPATGGVTSAEVRSAYKRIDHVKYGDMNPDLPRSEMDALVEREASSCWRGG